MARMEGEGFLQEVNLGKRRVELGETYMILSFSSTLKCILDLFPV